MDIQSNQGKGKILPRQPDTQDQTRRAGATLNQFTRPNMPNNGGVNHSGNGGNTNISSLQQLLARLISALLAKLHNSGQPPAPPPQPVYGAVLPPDPIMQPVYGVFIEPTPQPIQQQPVYGAFIPPAAPMAVYGAPII